MTLPHLLCVDDSEAILALERAVLAGHYALTTATEGRDALEKVRRVRPDGVLLDLSMPEMDGDDLALARMIADPELRDIPVIVISSERARAEVCLGRGAAAFLPKPIRASELLAFVTRVIEERRELKRRRSLAVLPVVVGRLELGLPLEAVRLVVLMPATTPLPDGPPHLDQVVEVHGETVRVLDLAALLGVEHSSPLVDRKLVLVSHEQRTLALAVDDVKDPAEHGEGELRPLGELGALGDGGDPGLARILAALIAGPRGLLPVIEPRSFFTPELPEAIPRLLRGLAAPGGSAP